MVQLQSLGFVFLLTLCTCFAVILGTILAFHLLLALYWHFIYFWHYTGISFIIGTILAFHLLLALYWHFIYYWHYTGISFIIGTILAYIYYLY